MSDSHEDLETLLTKYIEGAATDAERLVIEAHLEDCAACRVALEVEGRTRKALSLETNAISEAYDAGRLEANLAHELQSEGSRIRWLGALALGSGVLTVLAYVRPLPSQPEAWSALLSLTLSLVGALSWTLRRKARFMAIARAAQKSQGGYGELEKARLRVTIRDFRVGAWLGLAVAPLLPALVLLTGLRQRSQLESAFPTAKITVHLSGALVNTGVLSVLLIGTGIFLLWKARRLEKTAQA